MYLQPALAVMYGAMVVGLQDSGSQRSGEMMPTNAPIQAWAQHRSSGSGQGRQVDPKIGEGPDTGLGEDKLVRATCDQRHAP